MKTKIKKIIGWVILVSIFPFLFSISMNIKPKLNYTFNESILIGYGIVAVIAVLFFIVRWTFKLIENEK